MKLIGSDGQEYALEKPETTVGRNKSNDIAITDPKVSSKHAVIRRDGDAFLLTDLGSTNGTFVNESRLTEMVRLQPGDSVRFGDTSMTFKSTPTAGVLEDEKTAIDMGGAKADLEQMTARLESHPPIPSPRPAPLSAAPPPPIAPAVPPMAYPPAYRAAPTKDRSTTLILEILPGLLGFLGIGWIYAGETTTGILILIGYLTFLCASVIAASLSAGICLFFTIPISIVAVIMSVVMLNAHIKKYPERFV